MKLAFALLLLGVATARTFQGDFSMFSDKGDYRICTKDARSVVDDMFVIVETLEENYVKPPPEIFKALLHSLNLFLKECVDMDLNLPQYDHCVDDFIPVFAAIHRLIDDVQNGRQGDIVIDVSQIAFILSAGIRNCTQHAKTVVLAY